MRKKRLEFMANIAFGVVIQFLGRVEISPHPCREELKPEDKTQGPQIGQWHRKLALTLVQNGL